MTHLVSYEARKGLKTGCKIRRFDGLTGAPGESQDKGKEAQESLRRARGYPSKSLEAS